ncbi:transcriptional regulator BetI [Phyllobacterium myrsinacearum]|uniref:HTH-type transcriptional regulator BetI n=1 Tax=Phyllobacterium myrsinacearum TaxID=28101 RepID=A0A2S9JBM5_9HYPH|nr:transcriptional regulator BetI [Phyllobacterium myrsinacearum]PRD50207.1 transcriptional regulator BetI [Phyllobacterium myrsinacearum]PWV90734.1 TetR family transcriptional regulator [Phyllobacterium myrsinacearum]RZS88463.1 TetR family transcriptional regulator [Phyllobacterium myrsinacearum]RZU97136.1 TetR family transcriptional regulator [Phyllobacterium myrsinacearum]
MPKVGMEPLRKRELIDAAIRTIGQRGSLDVTVAEIAHEAGVSPALAHHYFGGKEQLMLATMRHLLKELGQDLLAALATAQTPAQRVAAIIAVNFSASQFAPQTVAAWLTFYVHAQQSVETRRLLRVYARRMQSNLAFALSSMTDRATALQVAEGTGAMIDGLYIRHALRNGAPEAASAIALVEDYVTTKLAAAGASQ